MSDPPPKAPIIRRRRPTGTIRADRAERILNEILRLQAEYVNGDEAPKVTCEEPGHRAFTSRKNVCLQSGAHFGQHYSMCTISGQSEAGHRQYLYRASCGDELANHPWIQRTLQERSLVKDDATRHLVTPAQLLSAAHKRQRSAARPAPYLAPARRHVGDQAGPSNAPLVKPRRVVTTSSIPEYAPPPSSQAPPHGPSRSGAPWPPFLASPTPSLSPTPPRLLPAPPAPPPRPFRGRLPFSASSPPPDRSLSPPPRRRVRSSPGPSRCSDEQWRPVRGDEVPAGLFHPSSYVDALVYSEGNSEPQPAKLPLRKSLRLVLDDHKVHLGELGLERGGTVQMLIDDVWEPVLWSHALKVPLDDLVLLKPSGLFVEATALKIDT